MPQLLHSQGFLSPVLKVLVGGGAGAGTGAGAGAVVGAVLLPAVGTIIPGAAIGGALGAIGAGVASLSYNFQRIIDIAKHNREVEEIMKAREEA